MPAHDASLDSNAAPLEPTRPMHWLDLSDESLLRHCKFEAFRGSGPGGQKRNKTSNAIRLTHLPTGLHVMARESRSAGENRARAVRRMKLRLALELRHPLELRAFEPPTWFTEVRQLGRLSVSHRHPLYARTAGLVLDVLHSGRPSVADAAALLGVTTSSVVKFLEGEPHLWTAVNALRKAAGLVPLERRN